MKFVGVFLCAVILPTALYAQPVAIPGTKSLPPHMHYEIRINPQFQKLTPAERLVRACDLAKALSEKMAGSKDVILNLDLSMLRKTTCGK